MLDIQSFKHLSIGKITHRQVLKVLMHNGLAPTQAAGEAAPGSTRTFAEVPVPPRLKPRISLFQKIYILYSHNGLNFVVLNLPLG